MKIWNLYLLLLLLNYYIWFDLRQWSGKHRKNKFPYLFVILRRKRETLLVLVLVKEMGKTKKRRRVPEVLWRLFRKRSRSLACTIESLLPKPSSMSSLVRDEKDSPQYRKLLNQCFLVLSENAPPISRFNPHSRWSQSQIVRRTIEMLISEQPMSSNVICNAYDKASFVSFFLSFFLLLTMLLLSTFFGKWGLQINHSTPIMELLCSPAWCLLLQRVPLLCFFFFN